MEKLTYIRNSMCKGSGKGKHIRRRLNAWNFHKLQKFIEYKARWEGMPVVYVEARNTSQRCSSCGCLNKLYPNEHVLKCKQCNAIIDRHVNASINILKRACGDKICPERLSDEVMNQLKYGDLTVEQVASHLLKVGKSRSPRDAQEPRLKL